MTALVFYAFGMAIGQTMLKLAADTSKIESAPLGGLLNRYFFVAITLYAVLTVLWIWLLRYIPLAKAYPFAALVFIFTPMLAVIFFGDKISFVNGIGMFMIVCGLLLAAQ
jgi:drug/metabolite transporter (DMT)-like permease